MKELTVLIRFVLSFISAALVCCNSANASDWAAQTKQIEALETQGQLSLADLAVATLVRDIKQSQPDSKFLPQAIDRQACIKQSLGYYVEAEHGYLEAIALWRTIAAGELSGLSITLNNLASLYSLEGQMTKAENLRRQSLALRIQLFGEDHPAVAISYSNLAVDLFHQRKFSESADLSHKALAIWSKGPPENNRSDLALNTLALLEFQNRNYPAALSFALQSQAQYRTLLTTRVSDFANYEHTIAIIRQALGQPDEADQAFKRALALLATEPEELPSPTRIGIYIDYARLLKEMKRSKEAHALLQKAQSERKTLTQNNPWKNTVELQSLLPQSNPQKLP